MLMNTAEYLSIIENIKSEIKAAQYRAAVHANADMLLLYHDITGNVECFEEGLEMSFLIRADEEEQIDLGKV